MKNLKQNIISKQTFYKLFKIHKNIPQPWLEKIKNSNLTQVSKGADIKIKVNKIYKPLNSVKCKHFYWQLVENKDPIPTCISKWHTNYAKLSVNIDEIHHYLILHKVPFIKDTSLLNIFSISLIFFCVTPHPFLF